jgi:hypothetical protein
MENPNETLEKLIDAASLSCVMEDLIAICHAKADHLRSNWQDESTARVWERDAATLEKARVKLHN